MTAALCLLLAHLGLFAAEPPATFGLTNIWTIELRVSPDSWRILTGARTFTRATVTVDGVNYTNVAVRQKGQGTTSGTGEGRPPLHLVFKGQSVAGVKKLSLNNNYFDTSYLRDVLSYKLSNDFGVAAPRTAFAKGLPSDGCHRRSPLSGPLHRHRDRGRGVPASALRHQGWPPHEAARAFKDEIASCIDVDNFLRFAVVNVALANCDSYFQMGKNFYLWLNPTTGKLTFIPWDFDLSFGGHFLFGTPEQRMNLSIDRPTDDRLVTRLLAIPEMKERYHALIREFVDKHLQVAVIEQQIDTLAALIEPAALADNSAHKGRFKRSLNARGRGMTGNGWQVDIGLKQFLEGRVASLNEQLVGRSKGVRPQFAAH